jgi:ribosomal protein S18 acetylase RimI-like enzyme
MGDVDGGTMMRKAGPEDRAMVVRVLAESFRNDPHVTWLLEESSNRNKLKILIEYVVDETFSKGEIYLRDDYTAAALWDSEKGEKVSLRYLLRNLSFLFRVGLKATIRNLKMNALIHNQYPKNERYCHLYLIGVLPERQGQGRGSALMDPMIEHMGRKSRSIYLETANPTNVEIYEKKGFDVFHTMRCGNNTLYWMKSNP